MVKIPECSLCPARSVNCAYGNLRGGQSCEDTRDRFEFNSRSTVEAAEKKNLLDYLLVVKIPLKALDDVDARQKAKELENNMKNAVKTNYLPTSPVVDLLPENVEYKLQRIHKNKPPEGVSI